MTNLVPLYRKLSQHTWNKDRHHIDMYVVRIDGPCVHVLAHAELIGPTHLDTTWHIEYSGLDPDCRL